MGRAINDRELRRRVENIDWSFSDRDTRYLTHNIHRYSGKYVPPVAESAIELTTVPGELVLDPYCGSGTTLLEAALNSRPCIGADLNPIGLYISRAKVRPVGQDRLERFHKDFAKVFGAELTGRGDDLFGAHEGTSGAAADCRADWRLRDQWFTKWFQPHVLRDLVRIYKHIMAYPDVDCRHIGVVVFSDILRRVSNAHSGYPNVMYDKRKGAAEAPIPVFWRRLTAVLEMKSKLALTLLDEPNVEIIRCNSQALPFADDVADAIVTHPPYVGSVPYAEYGALSLKWLGFEPQAVDAALTGGRRQSKTVLDRFKNDLSKTFAEGARVLKPGRLMFLLLGSPKVQGTVVDLPRMAVELAKRAGFTCVVECPRNGINRRANKMPGEKVLFFRNHR